MEVSNYAPMTDAEARFAATHYDIIGIGGTFGSEPHHGEAAQAAAAKQLKLHNANVTVLIYRNSNLVIDGQLQSDLVFDAHPEWLLRNASGAPVYNSPSQPFINFTDPAAREWWVSSCVRAITQQPNGSAIDGVWIDGAGDFEVMFRGLAHGQNALLNASHALAVKDLTSRLHAIRPTMMTLGNGAVVPSCGRADDGTKYGKMDWSPCARNLPFVDGVCAEHFGSFESVNGTRPSSFASTLGLFRMLPSLLARLTRIFPPPCSSGTTGNYDTDGGAAENHRGGNTNEKWQTALDIVKHYDGGSKVIIVKSWPGPFSVYSCVIGTWKNYSDANITLTNELKKTLGARALPWALAAYLLSASENSYMSYGWW